MTIDGVVRGYVEFEDRHPDPPMRWLGVRVRDDNHVLSFGDDVLLLPDDGTQVVVGREEWEETKEALRQALTWEGRLNEASQLAQQGHKGVRECLTIKSAVLREVNAARAILGTNGGGE